MKGLANTSRKQGKQYTITTKHSQANIKITALQTHQVPDVLKALILQTTFMLTTTQNSHFSHYRSQLVKRKDQEIPINKYNLKRYAGTIAYRFVHQDLTCYYYCACNWYHPFNALIVLVGYRKLEMASSL